MPRGKDVVLLKQACLTVIARNFDRLWAHVFDRHLGDVPRLLYVIGPFDNLPGQLCQDILHMLMKQRILRKTHLQLLLLPQLTHLDLSGASATSVSSQALDIISVRCRSMVSLNLANCTSLSSSAIAQCLEHLPLLRTLVLKRTKVNDSVLRTIASCLRHLSHLDLHACLVTDAGARWLTGDSGDYEPVCADIGILDISATKIDLPGCCSIVRCFHKLRYLSFADTIEAVARLHRNRPSRERLTNGVVQSDSGTSLDVYPLQTLHATAIKCKHVSPESVQIAALRCPNVREVYLYQNASDAALHHLQNLEHLSVLEITSDQPGEVTFHDGLLPLLQARGHGIISLGLYDVQDVDVGQIGILCSHLQRLKLVSMYEDADFAHSYIPVQQLSSVFSSLKHLTIVIGPDETRMQKEDLEHLLLNGHQLQEVHFINIQCLSDELLVSALSLHGFQSLTSLQLESCSCLTNMSLLQLIHSTNPLSLLTVKHCAQISYQDYEQLQGEVMLGHLNLNIEWE